MLLAARPTLPSRAVKAWPKREGWEAGRAGGHGPGSGAGRTWPPGRAAGPWGAARRGGRALPVARCTAPPAPGYGCRDAARPGRRARGVNQDGVFSRIPPLGRVRAAGGPGPLVQAGSAPLSVRVSEGESESSPFTAHWGSPLSNWLHLWKSKATGRIQMSDRSWQHPRWGSAPHKARDPKSGTRWRRCSQSRARWRRCPWGGPVVGSSLLAISAPSPRRGVGAARQHGPMLQSTSMEQFSAFDDLERMRLG